MKLSLQLFTWTTTAPNLLAKAEYAQLCVLQWDDDNPLVREYGLWAVRNLCEGNQAIQESISSLQVCSTVDSPDLQQIGMKLQLDRQTGKPRMVSR